MLFANEKRIYLKQNLIFKFDISIVFTDDHFANVLNRAALYIKVILTFPISKSADGFKSNFSDNHGKVVIRCYSRKMINKIINVLQHTCVHIVLRPEWFLELSPLARPRN